ncbi:hypothetical protein HAX54_032933 [Datura stramonium]|uniref:Uncharacterized protein n=1 Tax=Datura stramonium TaxID=4076 RepID=A0ABS8VDY7_DATST|nr:hypothetical protein [Datura stramonium]
MTAFLKRFISETARFGLGIRVTNAGRGILTATADDFLKTLLFSCIKQSVPNDKGKEKEKRPTEAESDFDLEFEEALRKTKDDEERQVELHRRYWPQLILEFYASYGTAQKHQKSTGLVRSRPCLEKVKVRGIQVECSAKAINKAYFGDDDAEATGYLAKLESPDNHYTWIGVEASLTPDLQTMGNTATDTSTQASDEALASSSAPPIAPQPM